MLNIDSNTQTTAQKLYEEIHELTTQMNRLTNVVSSQCQMIHAVIEMNQETQRTIDDIAESVVGGK